MLKRVCLPLIALLITSTILPSQTSLAGGCATCPDVFSALKWRCIGPHRGGRTVGASGVPQQPGTFYMGVNNGGVWKTTDYGRVWEPIFDDQPTGSIGDVAVAPSDDLLEKLKSNLEEVRSRGGELFVFADRQAGFKSEARVQVLPMPHCPEVIKPIVYTVALQLLSYHVALQKGTDVDKPRNLAKSVTVE